MLSRAGHQGDAMTMAWMARGISIAGALILAGCASRPLPSLAIVATAPGTSRIDLLVATTRKPSQDDGIRFSGERASMPSFATMTVSIPAQPQDRDVLWSATSPPDAASAFAAVGFTGLDGSRMREAVRQKIRLTGRSHVLVFVHGYNTRFDEAAFRLAQIVHDSQAP